MDDGGEERGDQNKTESGCLDAHQGEENTKCQPRAKGPTKAAATYDGTRENFPPTNDTAPPEQQSKARTTQKKTMRQRGWVARSAEYTLPKRQQKGEEGEEEE